MMTTDPMDQYDPATAALIAQQSSPQSRVANAMMQQQGGGIGGGLQGLGGLLQQLAMMKMMGKSGGMGGPRPPDPVMGTGYPQSPMDQASSLSYLAPKGGP